MTKYLLTLFLFTCIFLKAENIENVLNQEQQAISPNVDCIILQDENSIICKFELQRDTIEQNIQVLWLNPKGEISRQRDMLIPAGHGSIYDYRYLDGRELGVWSFKVIFKEKEYSTTFELK